MEVPLRSSLVEELDKLNIPPGKCAVIAMNGTSAAEIGVKHLAIVIPHEQLGYVSFPVGHTLSLEYATPIDHFAELYTKKHPKGVTFLMEPIVTDIAPLLGLYLEQQVLDLIDDTPWQDPSLVESTVDDHDKGPLKFLLGSPDAIEQQRHTITDLLINKARLIIAKSRHKQGQSDWTQHNLGNLAEIANILYVATSERDPRFPFCILMGIRIEWLQEFGPNFNITDISPNAADLSRRYHQEFRSTGLKPDQFNTWLKQAYPEDSVHILAFHFLLRAWQYMRDELQPIAADFEEFVGALNSFEFNVEQHSSLTEL